MKDADKAIEAQSKSGNILVQKDLVTDRWKWFGIPTNNFRDREDEILTANGHRRFVALFESKEFEELTGQPYPELWVWHVPMPIGYAERIGYDERGFLVAGGWGYEGEFYDKMFEGLARVQDTLGMSHGMPVDFLGYNAQDKTLIDEYLSIEFTALPQEWAANLITFWGTGKEKEMKGLAPHQLEWFTEVWGPETVAEIDSRLDEAVAHAKARRLDQKGMDTMNEEDEEVTEEEGKAKDAPAYVTADQLKEIVGEITKGVKDGVAAVVADLKADNAALRAEIKALKKSDDDKLADRIKETPALSLAGSIAQSIVGASGAEVKPKEKIGKKPTAGRGRVKAGAPNLTGVAGIDAIIARQKGYATQKATSGLNGYGQSGDDDYDDED